MDRKRKIADRDQRVTRLGPFSLAEWILLLGPILVLMIVARPPFYLILLLFCVDAGFILLVLRSFLPGAFKDWIRLQWDYARFGQSVFAPVSADVTLRHGDPFLTRRTKRPVFSIGLLMLSIAGLSAIYWVLFKL